MIMMQCSVARFVSLCCSHLSQSRVGAGLQVCAGLPQALELPLMGPPGVLQLGAQVLQLPSQDPHAGLGHTHTHMVGGGTSKWWKLQVEFFLLVIVLDIGSQPFLCLTPKLILCNYFALNLFISTNFKPSVISKLPRSC